VSSADYTLRDLGMQRVLTFEGREYPTYYSERVIRRPIERKGLSRSPFKETRGRASLIPLNGFRHPWRLMRTPVDGLDLRQSRARGKAEAIR
jgi:hypothetical protein